MQRIGLQLKVRRERLDEYLALHDPIWPELASELRAAGIQKYTLWIAPDGTEFGYIECDDWDKVCAYLARSPVHARWQELMQNYLETPISAGQGGQPVILLKQSFSLEESLAKAAELND
jgi:L-rhamnose mutarotase